MSGIGPFILIVSREKKASETVFGLPSSDADPDPGYFTVADLDPDSFKFALVISVAEPVRY